MAREITKEQQVVVRVCDEWLKEAGLPLYSDLASAQRITIQMQPCSCGVSLMCSVGCPRVVG